MKIKFVGIGLGSEGKKIVRKTNKLCPLFIAWLDAGAHVLLAPGYGCRPTAVRSSDLRTWVRTWTEPRFEVQVLISGGPGPLKRCRSRHMLNWTWGPNTTDLSTGEGLDENCLHLFESFVSSSSVRGR